MISVLFIILKIIGIAFLAIVGLLLILLLLVLFVPVRYRFAGGYEEAFHCDGKVTWLLHLLSIRIHVEEKVITDIRILGIPISFFQKKKRKNAKEEEKQTHKSTLSKDDFGGKPDAAIENKQTEYTDTTAINAPSFDTTDTTSTSEEETLEQTEKKSLFQKISAKIQEFIQKIKDVFDKIKNIFQKIKDFIQNAKGKKVILDRWLKILKSDMTKAAFTLCKKRLLIMLKHILPKKMLVNISYGFEDPADTGYTLAVYGMLPEYIGKRFVLHPDFNKAVFQCDFRLKGAIRMEKLLYQVLSVIRDKNCQRLYHIVKKEISNERK